MPDQGRIITKPAEDGTNQIVDFLFYDKYGHEISGIYERCNGSDKSLPVGCRSNAGLAYIPSFPIAPELAVPATPFNIRFVD